MSKYKKLVFTIFLILCLFCTVFAVACTDTESPVISGKDKPIINDNDINTDKIFYNVAVDNYVDVISYKCEEGQEFSVTAPDVRNKVFAGWYYQGKKVTENAVYTFTVKENASVRADYVDAFTLYLDAGEGTLSTDKVVVGMGFDFVLPIPEREHYYFLGWRWASRKITESDGKSINSYDINMDITLVAEYKEYNKYTVKISNGEMDAVETIFYEGDTVSVVPIELPEKKIVGWYEIVANNGIVEEVFVEGDTDILSFVVTKDVEYVLKYRQAYTVIIWFGSEIDIREYEHGETVEVELASIPTGKKFVGWIDMNTNSPFVDSTGEGYGTATSISFVAEKSIEIKANFDNIIYNLVYVLNGEVIRTDNYVYNENIKLFVPTVEPHKHFSGWQNAPAKMPASDTTLYGTMSWDKHTVTVEGGTANGVVSGEFDYGTTITLMPDEYAKHVGKYFDGWTERGSNDKESGDSEGVYSFILENDIEFVANYEFIDFTLTYILYNADWSKDGEVYKTVESLHYGTRVQLEAQPILSDYCYGHYDFGNWTVNGSEVIGSIVIPDSNVTVEGFFIVHRHSAKIVGGKFSDGSAEGTFDWDEEVTIIPDAIVGQVFAEWRNGEIKVSDQEEYTFKVKGDFEYRAVLVNKEYTIKFVVVDVDDSRTVFDSYTAIYEGEIRLPYTEPTGDYKVFMGWTFDGSADLPTKVFDTDEDIVLEGAFKWIEYSISVESNGVLSGTATPSGGYTHDTSVTANALYGYDTAEASNADWYKFVAWYVGDEEVSKEVNYTFYPTQNVTLRAEFDIQDYTVSFFTKTDDGEYGIFDTVSFNKNKTMWESILAEVKKTEKAHYDFSGWFLLEGEIDKNDTLAPADIEVYGIYTSKIYLVSVSYENEFGWQESIDTVSEEYVYNTYVAVDAPEIAGATFLRWTKSDGTEISTDSHYEIGNIDNNQRLVAVYDYNRYTLTFPEGTSVTKSGEWGQLTRQENEYVCVYNTVLNIIAPTGSYVEDGTQFSKWLCNGEEFSEGATQQFELTVTSDGNYTVVYSNKDYKIIYHIEGVEVKDEQLIQHFVDNNYQFVDGKENPQLGEYSKQIVVYDPIALDENAHYSFDGWYKDLTYAQKVEGFVMPASDVHVYGRFVLDKHDLTVVYKDENGEDITNFEGSKTGRYDYGTELQLDPGKVKGCHFVKWVIDSEDITDQNYTYTIKENSTIYVVFEKTQYSIEYKISYSLNDNLSEEEFYKTAEGYYYNEEVSLISDMERQGDYVFGGWIYDGNVVSTLVMPDENITVLGVYYSIYTYTEVEGGYAIGKDGHVNGSQFPAKLNIPSSYLDKPIVSIVADGFTGICSTEIIIPATVTDVAKGAFGNLQGEDVSITLHSIYGGFIGYLFDAYSTSEVQNLPTNLHTVNVEGCVIGNKAFYNTPIKAVNLSGVTEIGAYAFYGCVNITEMTIPSSVTKIGEYAFANLKGMVEFTYLASTAERGENLFDRMGSNGDGTVLTCSGEIWENFLYQSEANIVKMIVVDAKIIGKNAFRSLANLKEVVLPDTTTTIGNYAFAESGITAITISEYVTDIGTSAFSNCLDLEVINYNAINVNDIDAEDKKSFLNSGKTLNIGSSVQSIREELFASSNIQIVNFAEGSVLTTIAKKAFYGSKLSSVVLVPTLSEIGESAFAECAELQSIVYKATDIQTVGEKIFYHSGEEVEVTIDKDVENIPDDIFAGSERGEIFVTSVIFEEGSVCALIGNNAFVNNPISTLNLGKNVVTIGEYAFHNIDATSMVLPYSVEHIGQYAFGGENLVINCEATEKREGFDDNWATDAKEVNYRCGTVVGSGQNEGFEYVVSGDKVYITGYTGGENVVVPTVIEGKPVCGFGNVFKGMEIVTFTFEGSISLVKEAFKDCVVLAEVNADFGDTIPDFAFYGCVALSQFDLSNVKHIGDYAFTNSGLSQEVNLSSLVALGQEALVGCNISEFVTGSNTYFTTLQNALYDVSCKAIVAYPTENTATEHTVSDEVLFIEPYAFAGAKNLTSLVVSANVQKIGKMAFADCDNLVNIVYNAKTVADISSEDTVFKIASDSTIERNITIGNKVQKVPAYIFYNGENSPRLFVLTFEDTSVCTEIGRYAFYNNNFTSLVLPSSLIKIGQYAFVNTTITSIELNATLSAMEIGTFGTLGENAVLSVGNNVTAIPDNMFYNENGSNLSEVTFNSNSLTIGQNSFRKTALQSIELGNAVTNVEDYAFAEIDTLNEVTIAIANVDTDYSGQYVFSNSGDSNTLYTFVGVVPSYVFYGETTVKNIEMEEVTVIGNYSFYGIPYTSFDIPTTTTKIGEYAFAKTNLTVVTIPNEVKEIGKYAFYDIATLTTINYNATACEDTLSDNNNVFGGSGRTITVNIGSNVKRIPNNMFSPFAGNNTEITAVVFPVGSYRIEIGDSAFAYLKNATFTNLPKLTRKEAAEDAFYYVANAFITKVGAYAFYGCEKLTSFANATDLSGKENTAFKGIGNSAFEGCVGLTTLTLRLHGEELMDIKPYVYNLGNNAFAGCTALKTATLEGVGSVGVGTFKDCTSLIRVLESSRIGSFGDSAFEGCVKLEEIETDGALAIPSRMFYNCQKLAKISSEDNGGTRLGGGISIIGDQAFYGCSTLNITGIDSEGENTGFDNIVSIGKQAFYGCVNLNEITLGKRLETIGKEAFALCYKVQNIYYNAQERLPSGIDGEGKDLNIFYQIGSSVSSGTTLTIGKGVLYIPDYFFYSALYTNGYTNIKEIVFEDRNSGGAASLEIGVSAFAYFSIQSITIPNFVTSIGMGAFRDCTSLTTLILGDNVGVCNCNTISKNAFAGLTNLSTMKLYMSLEDVIFNDVFANSGISTGFTLTIGKNVTAIPERMFYSDTEENIAKIFKVEFESESILSTIGNEAFANNKTLTSIALPSSVSTIGSYAFYNCENLTNVGDMSGVTSIGYSAFYGTKLSAVTLGKNLSQIGSNAFANITTLTSVEIYIAVEIEAVYNLFEESGTENGTITAHVNSGCIFTTTEQVEELFAGDNGPSSAIVVTGL